MMIFLDLLYKRARLAMLGKGLIGLVGLIVVSIVYLVRNNNNVDYYEYESKKMSLRLNTVLNSTNIPPDKAYLFFDDTTTYSSKLAFIKKAIKNHPSCLVERAIIDNADDHIRCYKCWGDNSTDTILITTNLEMKIIDAK